ncbi:MAG TPA: EVE domain-containing protein [Bryobacteraceae bacterium]|nr:EVE domain-containing protein [Bryobacteraceae bacterium]
MAPSRAEPRWFLAKTEPGVYSIDHLQSDGETSWDGVRNPQAVRALRAMRPGDRVLIHHTGGSSAIVGVAVVTSEPSDDPKDPRSATVKLRYQCHVEPPVTLAEVKRTGLFADFALVRQSRLSTMEVPSSFIDWLAEIRPAILS